MLATLLSRSLYVFGIMPASGCGCLLRLCSRILPFSFLQMSSRYGNQRMWLSGTWSPYDGKQKGRVGRNLPCPCSLCFKVEANQFVIWLTASHIAKNISGAETALIIWIFVDNFKIHHSHGSLLFLFLCDLCEFIVWS